MKSWKFISVIIVIDSVQLSDTNETDSLVLHLPYYILQLFHGTLVLILNDLSKTIMT